MYHVPQQPVVHEEGVCKRFNACLRRRAPTHIELEKNRQTVQDGKQARSSPKCSWRPLSSVEVSLSGQPDIPNTHLIKARQVDESFNGRHSGGQGSGAEMSSVLGYIPSRMLSAVERSSHAYQMRNRRYASSAGVHDSCSALDVAEAACIRNRQQRMPVPRGSKAQAPSPCPRLGGCSEQLFGGNA